MTIEQLKPHLPEPTYDALVKSGVKWDDLKEMSVRQMVALNHIGEARARQIHAAIEEVMTDPALEELMEGEEPTPDNSEAEPPTVILPRTQEGFDRALAYLISVGRREDVANLKVAVNRDGMGVAFQNAVSILRQVGPGERGNNLADEVMGIAEGKVSV